MKTKVFPLPRKDMALVELRCGILSGGKKCGAIVGGISRTGPDRVQVVAVEWAPKETTGRSDRAIVGDVDHVLDTEVARARVHPRCPRCCRDLALRDLSVEIGEGRRRGPYRVFLDPVAPC